ncbi:MAG: hypothetical protein NUV54_03180, partial [Candidatus Taylorbacteria bacterium]|nr:hypothetical protein [Candidatus Taylorbacteria bacterium]
PNISVVSLKEHPVGKQFGVEPAAILTDEGLLLDPRVESWSPNQRGYFLGHELGHCLSGYLKSSNLEQWEKLMSIVSQLPVGESSHYIDYLDKELPEDHREARMAEEKLAELITQFLNGGGSFAGMISTKLLTFPDLPAPDEEKYRQLREHAQEFESLLNAVGSDEDPSGLLRQYPKLARHYEAWKAIKNLLTNPETFAKLEDAISGLEERKGYLDDDLLIDYPEMVEHLPALTPTVPEVKDATVKPVPKQPFSFLKFWEIFGD